MERATSLKLKKMNRALMIQTIVFLTAIMPSIVIASSEYPITSVLFTDNTIFAGCKENKYVIDSTKPSMAQKYYNKLCPNGIDSSYWTVSGRQDNSDSTHLIKQKRKQPWFERYQVLDVAKEDIIHIYSDSTDLTPLAKPNINADRTFIVMCIGVAILFIVLFPINVNYS